MPWIRNIIAISTKNTANNFFSALVGERDFPLSLVQLNDLVKNPSAFAGSAVEQAGQISKRINELTKGKIIKVDLQFLI